jgi:replicative DNA helicase
MHLGGDAGKLLSAVSQSQSVEQWVTLGLLADLFGPGHQECFNYIEGHIQKYGKLPTLETLATDGKYTFDDAQETAKYYFDRLIRRRTKQLIVEDNEEINKLVNSQKLDDVLKGARMLIDKTLKAITRAAPNSITDFRNAWDYVWPAYLKKISGETFGVMMGWPKLDNMTGGLLGGDLVSYVGRPATGKTFHMLYSAHYAWWTQKLPVLFVSMEMMPLLLHERLAAIHTSIPLSKIKMQNGMGLTNITLINQDWGKKISANEPLKLQQGLGTAKANAMPLWIVDGNLSKSVDDVGLHIRQLQPAVVYIDGAYLLRHPDARLNRYQRVAENCDRIKQIATELNVPLVASWQFSREATKKKKGDKPGLEDIGYSDAIGQHSSVVLGFFAPDSVETHKKRQVDILKGRHGEVGSFFVNWDFTGMNFGEYQELDAATKILHIN